MQDTQETSPLDLDSIRRRLAGQRGKALWRSLEEVAGTPAFSEFLHREFPSQASEWLDPAGRRKFLKIMGASLALAGLTGCTRQPREEIVPYVRQPEFLVPGEALYYATALTLGGIGTGVLVESHMGRPTKIEGNPQHPGSLGATDVLTQASILDLYDPDRAQTITHRGRIRTRGDLLGALRGITGLQEPQQGKGLRILSQSVSSPTLAAQIRRLLAKFPGARWHQYEPTHADSALLGARMAFGRDVAVQLRPEQADVLLALDSDFITSGPGAVRHAREYARRRQGKDMNRLYVVESSPTATGGRADHRLPLPPAEIEAFARALAARLGLARPASGVPLDQRATRWVDAVAADLQAHRGTGLVIAGDGQPPAVHVLAHAINRELGNIGRTVVLTDPLEAQPEVHAESLAQLTRDMSRGAVEALFILSGNPVYDAPADLGFGDALGRVDARVHLSTHFNETSASCDWHVPQAHELETWGDVRGFDGTVTLQQPLIEPLYDGVSPHELLAVLEGTPNRKAMEIVREHWKGVFGESEFETRWRRALHDGVVPDTRAAVVAAGLTSGWESRLPAPLAAAGDFQIVLRPDPTIHDGRFANNGWLQECPKPLTKLTWDNAALISPATAAALGIGNGDGVRIERQGRSLQAPAWILPGQADSVITAHLGYGRRRAGRVGSGAGFNAYELRTTDALWSGSGVTLSRSGPGRTLACTQDHHSMEGRPLVRHADLEEYEKHPDFAQHAVHEPGDDMSLFPDAFTYDGQAWGMTVDLGACTGCNTCVVACQAENNIPVVGREEVAKGREMHWIRVDRYFEGDIDEPAVHNQPVMCQHCENAPCEVVCPVAATVHSHEGLNDMVYNRCVGTRYCANNCPYKVRRFNFLLYSDFETPSIKLQKNPDVTVRSRGVMEKCSYCVQRISAARIDARKELRDVRDGDVLTACQQACPTGAIVFGDINDAGSQVAKNKADSRNYGLLTELNTRPRTTYLAAIRNPNPALEES